MFSNFFQQSETSIFFHFKKSLQTSFPNIFIKKLLFIDFYHKKTCFPTFLFKKTETPRLLSKNLETQWFSYNFVYFRISSSNIKRVNFFISKSTFKTPFPKFFIKKFLSIDFELENLETKYFLVFFDSCVSEFLPTIHNVTFFIPNSTLKTPSPRFRSKNLETRDFYQKTLELNVFLVFFQNRVFPNFFQKSRSFFFLVANISQDKFPRFFRYI